ncbi:hypothetical protein CXB51_016714 [Gossypium anomalum]|uniref:Uncharacterized protein n=1 Tax=Gossypium anomalum TaxID=47600 RepID=A0A8J5YFZ4_9ROSI|nr:hypothetical protein CXB51_016714 [Gossypium anomalum]
MLGAQLCYRTFSTFWVFSHKSNVTTYPTIPAFSFPSICSSSICLHFTAKLQPVSCHSICSGSFDPQFNEDDGKDLQFLEASLLVSGIYVQENQQYISLYFGSVVLFNKCPDQFHLVQNVVEKLGYEVW